MLQNCFVLWIVSHNQILFQHACKKKSLNESTAFFLANFFRVMRSKLQVQDETCFFKRVGVFLFYWGFFFPFFPLKGRYYIWG